MAVPVGHLTIKDPLSLVFAVDLSGLTAYDSEDLDSQVTFPQIITTETTYYFKTDGLGLLSVKYRGQEILGNPDGPITIGGKGGSVFDPTPDVDIPGVGVDVSTVVSVKDFGAAGDGVTDDLTAIQLALTALDVAGGGVLRVPKGTYLMGGATGLSLASNNSIRIEAEPGAAFDMRTMTASIGIKLGGSLGSSAALTSDANEFDDTIWCPLAVQPGDIIKIMSTDVDVAQIPASRKGELAQVVSTTEQVITLSSPLFAGYTAATTTVTKVNAPKIAVEGLTILRDTNDMGMQIQYARDIAIRDCEGSGARERLFNITSIFGGTIENCRGRDFYYSGSGTSYGIALGDAQHISVIGCDFRGGRHALANGGTYGCRDIQVIGGTYDNVAGLSLGAIDFHSNCHNVRLVGVTGLGPLSSHASNTAADNCTFRARPGNTLAAAQLTSARDCDYLALRNCDVQHGDPAGEAVSITVREGTLELVELSGTFVGGLTNGRGIEIGGDNAAFGPMAIERIAIDADVRAGDNTLYFYGTGGYPFPVPISRVEVRGRQVAINDTCIEVLNPDVDTVVIDSAFIETRAVSGRAYSGNTGDPDQVFIRNSRLLGTGGGVGANYFGESLRVVIQDSTIEGFGNQGGIVGGTTGEMFISNTLFIGNTGTPTLPARHYYSVNSAGKVTTQGTTAPTSGTWAVGDKCLNTAPTAGGPSEWVCTTAGTPGTWKDITPAFLNPKHYGCAADGTTDDTANFQACIDAANTLKLPIYVPAGTWILNGIVPFTGMRMMGSGRGTTTRLRCTTGDLLNISSNVFHVNIEDLRMETSGASAGHLIAGSAGLHSSRIHNVEFIANLDGKSAVNIQNMIKTVFDQCVFQHTLTATVPTVNLQTTTTNVNCNVIRDCTFINSGDYSIRFEGLGGATCNDNVIEGCVFEIPNGGAIDLLSTYGTLVSNSAVYDLSAATTKDLLHIGKSTSGSSVNGDRTTVIDWRRAGGTLGVGLNDVKLDNSSNVILMNLDRVSSGMVIDLGGKSATLINCRATLTNDSLAVVVSGGCVRPGKAATGSRPAATIGQGFEFFDTTLGIPIWSDGAVWRDAAGTSV